MIIKDRAYLEDSIDMLQGNINRMCITDDIKELNDMKEWAMIRIDEIHSYNLNKLNNR